MKPQTWLQWSKLYLHPQPAPWRRDSRAGLSCLCMLKSLSPLQIKAIAAKPGKLSGRVGLKNESHLHWKMRAVHRPNTPPSNLLDTPSEMCMCTIAQICNVVLFWCSGAHWLGWLHRLLIQSVLNLYVSILQISGTELAAMYQKKGKRSKLSQQRNERRSQTLLEGHSLNCTSSKVTIKSIWHGSYKKKCF